MGTSIGQTPAALARLDNFTVRRRARAGEERLSGQTQGGRSEEAEVRAGFGEGTLSAQGAALKTVSTNLRRARELVPSVEESQARARAAAAEAAARFERQTEQDAAEAPQNEREAAPAPTLVTARPPAEPRARFFAQEDDNTPVASFAPVATAVSGTEAPAPSAPQTRDRAAALLDILA